MSTPIVRRTGMSSLYAELDARRTAKPGAERGSPLPDLSGESKARSNSQERPYNVYRSAPRGLRARLRGEEDAAVADQGPRRRRDDRGGPPREGWRAGSLPSACSSTWRSRSSPGCCCRWSCSWSAPRSRAARSRARRSDALTSGPNMLTGTDTILSSAPTSGRRAPRSRAPTRATRAAARTRSCCGGSAAASRGGCRSRATRSLRSPATGRRRSTPPTRYGGPALAIKTIEQFTGVKINHLIIVNLANFPKFIDAIGGVDVKTGPDLLEHQRRRHERRLLAVPQARRPPPERDPGADATRGRARTRCNAAEHRPHPRGLPAADPQLDQVEADLADARFFRLPWASWDAPQALRTDMGGFTLLSLFAASEIGGSAPIDILKPSGSETLPDGEDALIALTGGRAPAPSAG